MPTRLIPAAAVLSAFTLASCAEGPPSCRDKLIGAWLRTDEINKFWVAKGQPQERSLSVSRLALNAGGQSVQTSWFEDPARRGIKDPAAPEPFESELVATWEVQPSGSTDPNRCYFIVDNDDSYPRRYTVTFEGPDRFVEAGSNATYDRDTAP